MHKNKLLTIFFLFISITSVSQAWDGKTVSFKDINQLDEIAESTLGLKYVGKKYNANMLEKIVLRFPKLQLLDFPAVRSNLKDKDLLTLSKLTSLKALRIRFSERISPQSITALKTLRELQVLDFSYTANLTTDKSIAKLPILPKLKKLILCRHRSGGISQKSLLRLNKLPSLKHVMLTQSHPIVLEKILQPKFAITQVEDSPGKDYFSRAIAAE